MDDTVISLSLYGVRRDYSLNTSNILAYLVAISMTAPPEKFQSYKFIYQLKGAGGRNNHCHIPLY
jgi:hypothetical protein